MARAHTMALSPATLPQPSYLWSGRGDQHASHQTIPLVHSLQASGSSGATSAGDITCLQGKGTHKNLL